MARDRVVEQLPSTAAIQDPQVRAYLDSLTNAWALRNGDVGDGNHRFVTKKEFNSLSVEALHGFFSGGPGGGGSPAGRPPSQIGEVIESIAQSVFASQLFRELGEQITRITAPWDTIDHMNGIVQSALSKIKIVENGITRIDSVVAGSITTIEAINVRLDTAEAQIIQINTVSASSTSANALALFALTGRVNTAEASITQLNTISLTSTSANASSLYQVRASLGNVVRTYFQDNPPAGPHTVGDQWFDTNDSETHYYWNGTSWVLGSLSPFAYSDAGILTESTASVSRDNALAHYINHVWATMGGVAANVQDGVITNVVAAQTAFASRWGTVQSAVYDFTTNTNYVAAVNQRLTTTIDLVNGKFQAAYTLRVEVGPSGRTTVGGFGILGNYDAGLGATIDFGVRADRFWITSTSAAADDVNPFTVQTTAGPWGNPGVYIKSAMIQQASISVAMIEQQIQSSNYFAGVNGWAINSQTGNAEFNNVLIRGTSTVGRLNVTGAEEGSVFVPDNGTTDVVHNEGRRVIVTMWSASGTPNLTSMTLNSFTIRLDFSAGGTVHYRYF